MKCLTCKSVMERVDKIEGIVYNLVKYKCPKCSRSFTQHVKRFQPNQRR